MGFSTHGRGASEHRTMVCTLITLDRPDKRDAADEQTRTGPAEARTDAAADRWTRVVVATGAGRAFSAEVPLAGRGRPGAFHIPSCDSCTRACIHPSSATRRVNAGSKNK